MGYSGSPQGRRIVLCQGDRQEAIRGEWRFEEGRIKSFPLKNIFSVWSFTIGSGYLHRIFLFEGHTVKLTFLFPAMSLIQLDSCIMAIFKDDLSGLAINDQVSVNSGRSSQDRWYREPPIYSCSPASSGLLLFDAFALFLCSK